MDLLTLYMLIRNDLELVNRHISNPIIHLEVDIE